MMIEAAQPSSEPARPRTVLPMLLSFVAGYVDSYTYLALFGLFAAQVTGSFIIAGAELVRHDNGVAGKLLAIPAFVVAAAATAAVVGIFQARGRPTLALILALEAVLLGVFAGMTLSRPIGDVSDPYGIVAGLFAAAAMGTQSVAVRLLLRGVPQTNVMTGNMTQLGIEATELIKCWRRRARTPADTAAAHAFDAARRRLGMVLAVAIGFVAGGAAGALAFAMVGLRGVLLATAILIVLAAISRERGHPRR